MANDWLKIPVSTRFIGDPNICQEWFGQAQALRFAVRNSMRLSGLRQGQSQQFAPDGTRIRVKCLSTGDIIEIETQAITPAAVAPSCTITLLNVPAVVQPMKNPGQILSTEVAGVDYIKTYYTVNSTCTTCQNLVWNVCTTTQLGTTLPCAPFIYKTPSEPYFQGDPAWTPPIPADPTNHAIYSLYGPVPACQAEIIQQGQDNGGTYIIWKAYTEWPQGATFSCNGLAYLKLMASISDQNNNVVCYGQSIIKVDCCQKNPNRRNVQLWYSLATGDCGQPFMFYAGVKICQIPPRFGNALLRSWALMSAYDKLPLLTIPDVLGSCLPFTWTFGGMGSLSFNATDIYKTIGYFTPENPEDCHSTVQISVADRCGTKFAFSTYSLCDDPLWNSNPLSIGYTTLWMAINQSQDLQAVGGIGPFSWSLAGPGTLSIDPNTGLEMYTAPASASECPSVTVIVTDCCGNTASIQIQIGGGNPNSQAYCVFSWEIASSQDCAGGNIMTNIYNIYQVWYDCLGNLTSSSLFGNIQCDSSFGISVGSRPCCDGYQSGSNICDQQSCTGYGYADIDSFANGLTVDHRSASDKANGCCPPALV